MLEQIKETHPHVLTRRFNMTGQTVDKKDCGLRVPRRIVGGEKNEKKKGGVKKVRKK